MPPESFTARPPPGPPKVSLKGSRLEDNLMRSVTGQPPIVQMMLLLPRSALTIVSFLIAIITVSTLPEVSVALGFIAIAIDARSTSKSSVGLLGEKLLTPVLLAKIWQLGAWGGLGFMLPVCIALESAAGTIRSRIGADWHVH